MKHHLPELPYAYGALEPYYDEQTVRIHHDAHHKAYVDGLNNAGARLTEARAGGDFALIKHWERELAFHGSGHLLHNLFWESMSPSGGGEATGPVSERIKMDFGGFEIVKKELSAAAVAVEGSGWALLCWNPQFASLVVLTAEKHQNLTQWGVVPLLALDVWEHAYYLKYQNKRAAWVDAWWNLVNWESVNDKYRKAAGL